MSDNQSRKNGTDEADLLDDAPRPAAPTEDVNPL